MNATRQTCGGLPPGRLVRHAALIAAVTIAAGQAQSAVDAESAFRAARAWTVRVRLDPPVPPADAESGGSDASGFVVDAERGWVMTNAHVAGRWPSKLQIAFEDGRPIPAVQVYVDPHLDVAVISYLPAQLKRPPPRPTLECGSIPAVGHPVGTVGHPWGFRFTGTRGIASAVTSRNGVDMLQTDAPTSEGSSGGPLISLETGRVVGINAAKINHEKVEGISFAVPMRYACTILKLLQAGRDPSPPADRIDFAIEENDERGLLVARSRIPTASLDLRSGDEILAARGTPVATPTQWIDAIRGSLDAVMLTVRRGGKDVRISGRLPAAPKLTDRQGMLVDGALIASADDFVGDWMSGRVGLMVHEVDGTSEAAAIGLLPFDVVERVNGRPVRTLDDLEQAIAKSTGSDRRIELMLLRLSADGPRLLEYQRRYLRGAAVYRVGGDQ